MRKVESLSVEYVGYKTPETTDEIEFEILGLELASCEIKSRIARLKQAVKLSSMLEPKQPILGDVPDDVQDKQ